MDQLYALGISVIVLVQKSFVNFEDFFERINYLADPNHGYSTVCPLIATLDSVFGAQCFASIATANWMNTLLKWALAEHRPYWWIRETQWYGPLTSSKPRLRVTHQSCETGPGSPSGHVMYITTLCILISFWSYEIDIKACSASARKKIVGVWCTVVVIVVALVSTARIFIATHFPHQCFMGFLCGSIVVKLVNSLVINQSIYPISARNTPKSNRFRLKWINFLFSIMLITSSLTFYWVLKLNGIDPQWTIKLAFKWCPNAEFIHVSTTPIFSFVESAGTFIGFSLCASPFLQRHRYFSEYSVLTLAFATAIFSHVILGYLQAEISRDDVTIFYMANLLFNVLRVIIFLHIVPWFATSVPYYWKHMFCGNRQARTANSSGCAISRSL